MIPCFGRSSTYSSVFIKMASFSSAWWPLATLCKSWTIIPVFEQSCWLSMPTRPYASGFGYSCCSLKTGRALQAHLATEGNNNNTRTLKGN